MSILVKYAHLLEQNEALAKENAELKAWKEYNSKRRFSVNLFKHLE